MLQNTFRLLSGHGPKTEHTLWNAGVTTWEAYRHACSGQKRFFADSKLDTLLDEAEAALARADSGFFAQRLPKHLLYRVALTFPDATMFLDIESTGLSVHYDEVTLIGWQLGGEFSIWVSGEDPTSFLEALASAKAAVTFNGTLFDLPFIKKRFPEAKIPQAHIDLRYLVKHVGLKGGQKAVEDALQFDRSRFSDVKSGEFAPALWYDYIDGDVEALRRLVSYNFADIQGLRFILDHCVANMPDVRSAPKSVRTSVPEFYPSAPALKFAKSRFHKTKGIYLRRRKADGTHPVTLETLYACARPARPVIGMDLTGSEARATGVCVLDGSAAETYLINTDADLLALVDSVKPEMVSIDSPLSLPVGRTKVEDSDPGRQQYGITRYCERTLKKRGINVYPCLIQSMQKLTARGIRLATKIRMRGIPVIESYPGAAQDIMRIPRKRASIERLRSGLVRFGVRGAIESARSLNHDELDAITAAVVAVFHWSGRFEALGNEDEDYLIIPDLSVDPKPWLSRRVFGFSGRIYSGKTTAAKHLESAGYSYGRFSSVLAEMLAEEGQAPTRENLQELGVRVFESSGGQRRLGQRLCRSLADSRCAVVDGLRHSEDHALLVENFGPAFEHIHVDASHDERRARYLAAGYSASDFKAADSHNAEVEVGKLSGLAHKLVENNSTIEDFTSSIDALTAHTQHRESEHPCQSA